MHYQAKKYAVIGLVWYAAHASGNGGLILNLSLIAFIAVDVLYALTAEFINIGTGH